MSENRIGTVDAMYGIMRANAESNGDVSPEELITELVKMFYLQPEDLPEILDWLVAKRKERMGFNERDAQAETQTSTQNAYTF